jgi:hypothetical protein
MDNYKTGDLVEATIIEQGERKRVPLTYIPDRSDEHGADILPFRRLVPNDYSGDGWYGFEEMTDIVRLVAVPVVTREQVIEALTDQPDILASDAAADAVLSLFGQAGGKR